MTDTAWTLLAAAGALAFGDWIAVARHRRGVEYLLKPAALAALIAVAVALDPDDGAARAVFVVALSLSLAGDVFLMLPGDLFLGGLLSFLKAHIAYVIGLVMLGVSAGPTLLGLVFIATATATVGARIVSAVREGDEPEMAIPVGIYMGVISGMVVAAFGTGRALAAAGAALFYASDALIAWNRFVREWSWARVAIMVTYHAGQAGLVLSLVA